MKLIGDLKKKVDEANTKEEAKELIANAGMELTEEEMDAVSGGVLYRCPKPTLNQGNTPDSKCF